MNYNFSNGTSHSLSSFPGIEGNTFTRGQSAMIGLTQNWTKTFLHTSQFYFSRNRSLGLNEFSNVTDISSQLGITGISPNPFDYGLPSINFTNFTGLSDPNFSLSRSQTYRYVDSLRWMKDEAHGHASAAKSGRWISIATPIPRRTASFPLPD